MIAVSGYISYPETAHGPTKTSIRVKHGAMIRVTEKYPDHTTKTDMPIEQLEGHLLVLGCLYNVSGYYNPYRPKMSYKIINKSDILQEGELCNCGNC